MPKAKKNRQGAHRVEEVTLAPRLIKPKRLLSESVWDLALERTRYVYDNADHVAVSFSGGKDSAATMHVALEVAQERGALPLHVVFFDEEAIPPETVDYVRRVSQRDDVQLDWMCLPVRHRNACSESSPNWYPWAPEARELWCRELPPEAITEADGFPAEPDARPTIPEFAARLFPPDRYGATVQLLGLRATESLQRQNAVRKRRGDNFIIPDYHGWGFGNVSVAYPIYDWGTDDVWRAPARYGWDYNRAYDVMEMMGLTPHQQRCAPPFGEEPIKKLWTFQHGWPELWDKMSRRVPGAASAARYAGTELYGYGSIPPRPPDMPWDTFLLMLLERHADPKVRAAIAYRLRKDIERHYAKTTDPILFKSPHPVTGMNYRYLVQLAIRADLKERRPQPYVGNGPGKREEAWRRYNEEREASGVNGDRVRASA